MFVLELKLIVELGEKEKTFSGKVLSLFPKPHHLFPNLLLAFIFCLTKNKCPKV